ncbi:uncharacterized protein LOC119725803 [Patiria miniata]|uniref:Uncharacterized protein n=1 Tax=Patiria miniata TaxID=46514 RepID=A0A913ZQG5_PATMI|nr:uncharacterized protein LOC119725803 [Patiria miniata]
MDNDNMRKDLLSNEVHYPNEDDPPPPYNPSVVGPGLAPPVDPHLYRPPSPGLASSTGYQQYPQQQYQQQQYPQQQYPHTQQPVSTSYPQAPQVVHHVTGSACPSEVFAREECFAECVRFWWCRPIGWLAKGELARARTLYLAGDYVEAQAAARCANVWSTVGLVTGLVVVAVVAVAIYLIVAFGIN